MEEGILSADEQEITTEQKRGSKNKRSIRYAGLADQFSAKMGKKKKNSIESVVTGAFMGMTMLPGEEQRWEVWLHEQCAIWAAGVYMAGTYSQFFQLIQLIRFSVLHGTTKNRKKNQRY